VRMEVVAHTGQTRASFGFFRSSFQTFRPNRIVAIATCPGVVRWEVITYLREGPQAKLELSTSPAEGFAAGLTVLEDQNLRGDEASALTLPVAPAPVVAVLTAPSQVLEIQGSHTDPAGAATIVQFHDATIIALGSTPREAFALPAGGTFSRVYQPARGRTYRRGLIVASSTTWETYTPDTVDLFAQAQVVVE
jgi:hypothetical protein